MIIRARCRHVVTVGCADGSYGFAWCARFLQPDVPVTRRLVGILNPRTEGLLDPDRRLTEDEILERVRPLAEQLAKAVLSPNDGLLPLYICAGSQCLEYDLSPVAEAEPEHRANYTIGEQNRVDAQPQPFPHMAGEPVAYVLDRGCTEDVALRTADLVHQGRLAGAEPTSIPLVASVMQAHVHRRIVLGRRVARRARGCTR